MQPIFQIHFWNDCTFYFSSFLCLFCVVDVVLYKISARSILEFILQVMPCFKRNIKHAYTHFVYKHTTHIIYGKHYLYTCGYSNAHTHIHTTQWWYACLYYFYTHFVVRMVVVWLCVRVFLYFFLLVSLSLSLFLSVFQKFYIFFFTFFAFKYINRNIQGIIAGRLPLGYLKFC